MTDDQIKARVFARERASILLDLADDAIMDVTEDQLLAFWTEIRDRALAHAQLPDVVAKSKIVPMTERQAEMFERSDVPYGRHYGLPVLLVMEMEPEWLDWLAGEPDLFKEDCKRYLASERGKARLEGRAVTVSKP